MILSVPHGRSASQLAATSDYSMLEQATAAVAAATGARSAYLERLTVEPDVIEIVAALGPDSPTVGFGPRSRESRLDAYVLPLKLDQHVIGNIVALDVPPAVVLDATSPGQLELLACVGALALRNMLLARELETASARHGERKFRVINGIVQYMKEILGAAGEYVQLLDTEGELTSRQQEYIRASRRNLALGTRVLSELQELGRVETGRVRLEYTPIDIGAVVRGMLRDYELADGTSGMRFESHVEPQLGRITSDLDMLRHILDALLSNAVRFTPPSGAVLVTAATRHGRRARDPERWICVSVTDQGPGVPDREQVFEEVSRAETVGTAPGFRLAISRHQARLLGGDLTLETQEGKGSTFTLWLPCGQPLKTDGAAPRP